VVYSGPLHSGPLAAGSQATASIRAPLQVGEVGIDLHGDDRITPNEGLDGRRQPLVLDLTALECVDPVGNATPDQPSVWTTVVFEFPEESSDEVASGLAAVLNERGGWYSHFNVNGETFVIFAGRIFRYPSGDKPGRAEAAAHGRRLGVPESQLDWDEYE
jgi:hypothetical protein